MLCFFLLRLINTFDFEGAFASRSVGTQGGFQAAGTCVAVAFGLVGGAIVGEFDKNMLCISCNCFPNSLNLRQKVVLFYTLKCIIGFSFKHLKYQN